MSVFLYYFGWPHGQIWPNLAASVVCAGLVWWRLHVQAVAHHVELLIQAERHHRELRAHVTATVTAAVPPQKRLTPRIPGIPARPGGEP